MKQDSRQLGIALLMIVWFIALFSLLALGFTKVMRSETLIARNLVESTQAKNLAAAAVERGVYGLLEKEPAVINALISGVSLELTIGDARLSYKLQEETGKLDINNASVDLIENLLLTLGVTDETAISISQALADWRDEDDSKQPHGAEHSDYADTGMLWMPSNAPFRSIYEIRHVMGITADIYNMIAPLITVYNASENINPKFAPHALLKAIPGIDAKQLESYIEARESLLQQDDQNTLPLLTGVEFLDPDLEGEVYSVFARAELPSGTVATRRLVVWIPDENHDRPYFVLNSGQDYPPLSSGKDKK